MTMSDQMQTVGAALANQELTRQIYWAPGGEIGAWLRVSMYVWLVLGLAVAGYGIWRYVQRWRLGRPERCWDQPYERFVSLLRDGLAQARVLRRRRQRDGSHSGYAAWMHGLIFYGFMALVFGTTVVALEEHGILRLYRGWFYGFVTVLCEVGGVALAVGLAMGIARRSKKNSGFDHGLDYWVLYLLLLILTVQGFALEAMRLMIQENPIDAGYSFVGWGIALGWSAVFGVPQGQSAEWIYAGLWSFHMLTTMGFLAAVPYSRAMHIVTAALNLYTERQGPRVNLRPMDLTNEAAEHFGPKTVTEFTWKDLLSFDSCTECRRCTDICPANAVGKDLDPRAVILKLRDAMRAEAVALSAKADHVPAPLYESGTITADEVWACTNCGACVSECPVGIDQMGTIMELRRYQTLSLGEVPQAAAKAIENVLQHGNPWGLAAADRMNWAKGLDLPLLTEESPQVEWLYWIGCAGSYDPSNQNVTRSVIKILKASGVSFAVMGKGESCSGEPVKRLGDEYNFSEIARSNVAHLKNLKFAKLVTHCPHCFNTLKNDYKEYGGDFEVFHHTQLIAALSSDGLLNHTAPLNNAASGGSKNDPVTTYHDPCFLGRHNGEYDAPRQALLDAAGVELVEMELARETSSCCGMGGGNMWFESKGGTQQIVEDRLGHVAATGAKRLVTGCSFCLINFRGALGRVKGTEGLEVVDVAQVVAERLPASNP
jgi:Fe-S oxidoreductase